MRPQLSQKKELRFPTDKSYLPPDLFAADGPCVCVGRSDGPVAPEQYLKKLRSFDQPLLVKGEDAVGFYGWTLTLGVPFLGRQPRRGTPRPSPGASLDTFRRSRRG
jgi:hypothetical protein